MSSALLRGGLALVASLVLAPVVLALLRRGGVLDHPCERSSHSTPVPRGGGVAIAGAALMMLAITPSPTSAHRWAIAIAAGLFGLLGLMDDVFGIRALYRLVLQFPIAAVAGWFLLDGLVQPALWWVFVAGVIWIVGFVNAYNFMDGINGISVAQAVGAGATWFAVGTVEDVPVLAAGGAIVAGAVLGFAPYNLPRARMFLGDAGSYFVGAWLATVAILGLRAGIAPEAVLAPLALYAADAGATLARRVARGEPWYLPHRDHAYQRLGDTGWSHVQVSALVAACIVACGAIGAVSLSGSVPARFLADLAIAAVVGAYLLAPRWLAQRASTLART